MPSSTSERQGKKLCAVPRGIYQVIQKVLSNFHNKMTKKKICHETKKIQFDRDSVSTLPSIQKVYFEVEISQEIHFQIRLSGSVLERQCQGLCKSVIYRACAYF